MSDIFISYSRRNLESAQKIVVALAASHLDTWVDWNSIPKGEDWEQEIYRGIEAADAFLFLVSPDSVVSDMCNKEIAHAVRNGKRILPVFVANLETSQVYNVTDKFIGHEQKKEINRRNFIFCRKEFDDFDKAIAEIQKTIHTNYDWVRFHTDLLIKAKRWAQKQDNSRLLRGKELREAEHQIAVVNVQEEPQPTQIQKEYILASQRNEIRTRRQITIGLSVGLIIVALLAVLARYQGDRASRSEATAVAEANAKATALVNEQNARTATHARELASRSVALYEPSLFDLSLLFSVEAFHTLDTPGTRGVLLDKTQSNPQLLQYLITNIDSINSVAFSPDGKTIASGNTNGTVTLWNVDGQKPISQTLTGHSKLVSSVTFSPDGRTLVSCGWDNTIILWDVASRQPIGQPLKGELGAPFSIAFSPDGKLLATGNGNSTVTLWDINKHQAIGEPFTGHMDWVTSVAFSPNGKILAAGSIDRSVILWDLATRQTIIQLPAQDYVRSVAFNPDGKILAVGAGNAIKLWNVETHQAIGEPLGRHTRSVSSVAFSPNGKVLASASLDKSIILWDVETLQPTGQPLTGHTGEISSLAFSPDGQTLISGSCGKVYEAAGETAQCTKSEVIIWSTGAHQVISQMLQERTFTGINRVDITRDGKTLAASDASEAITLWDMETGTAIQPSPSPYYGSNVTFSPDGKILASSNCGKVIPFDCTQGGEIILWDLETHQPIGQPLKGHLDWIFTMMFSPDGKILASASCGKRNDLGSCTQGEVILWDVKTQKPVGQPLTGHTSEVWSLAFSPDGDTLLTGSSDKTIILWDMATFQPIAPPLLQHNAEIFSLAFGPDGKTFTSGGADKNIVLWDVASRQPVGLPFKGHTHYVENVFFSPDGNTLVSGSADGTIILWDVASHQALGLPLTGYPVWISSLAFSRDGKKLVSGHDDGAIVLWDVDPQSWSDKTCQRVGRNFTQAEWQQYFPEETYHITCPQWPAGE
jgi:WD40 repeat protein